MIFDATHWKPRLATRLCFAAAGFGVACWAPLVPFAKLRLGIGEGSLGLILLCLGTGSVIAMPLAGALATRFGSRPLILAGGFGISLFLPFLAFMDRPFSLGAALFAFGGSLGSLDVAINLHAVEIERAVSRPLMSGFHALFSIGGFAGSGFMTLMLSYHIGPFRGALAGAMAMVCAFAVAAPSLLRTKAKKHSPLFVLPRGVVLVLALLAFVAFLAEGALLDWSALLLVSSRLVTAARGGIGYMVFSIAMTASRLAGDRIVARLGDRRVFLIGGTIALCGFALLLAATQTALALTGFMLIGLGAANIVPILFRRAGRQKVMPTGLALASITTAGYSGMLVGPAFVGFVAHAFGLRGAFLALALLFCLVPALNKTVAES